MTYNANSSVKAAVLKYVPFVVSGGIVAFLLSQSNIAPLLDDVQIEWLVLAVALSILLNGLVGSYKFWRVLRLCSIQARWPTIARLWASLWISTVLPFQSGHLLYVIAIRNQGRTTWSRAVEAVAYDRYLVLVSLLVLVLVGQLLLPEVHGLSQTWLLVGAGSGVVFFFTDGLLLGYLRRFGAFRSRFALIQKHPPLLLKLRLLAITVVYETSELLGFVLVIHALGLDVPTSIVLGAYPIVMLLSLLPISVSGLGTREAAIVTLMGASMTLSEGLTSGIMVHFIEHLIPAMLGLLFFRSLVGTLAGRSRDSNIQDAQSDSLR